MGNSGYASEDCSERASDMKRLVENLEGGATIVEYF